MSFTRQACPVWLFVDLDGNILDDTYYAHFLTNEVPYIPKRVYQDAEGTTPWSNPLQFYANGTLPNNLYFETDSPYRIEIRQGSSQSDPLIYLIQNFTPESGSTPIPSVTLPTDNQITNPQFTQISFNESLTITNTGTNSYDIAPGWVLELVGNATIQLDREAIQGDDPIPETDSTNPSYVLKFTVSNGTFTSVKLRQRFNETPAIWSDQGISVNLTAKMGANSDSIIASYRPSSGTAIDIFTLPISATYTQLAGGTILDPSDSTDSGASAYVDIVFTLPVDDIYYVTNIQVVGGVGDGPALPYAQITPERQLDHSFHYYADALIRQPKSNLLAGWTFALNPWQFRDPASANVATNEYTADQTIIIQQAYVTSGTGNNVAVGRASHTANYAYQITAATAANKAMVLTYIAPQTIRPYWGEKLSVRVRASITKTAPNVTPVTFKLRLIHKSGLPGVIAQTVPVSVWANTDNAIPTISGDGWTYLESANHDPTYTLTGTMQEFDFDGFELPASDDADMTLGVALIPMNNMDAAGTPDVINIEEISLVHNDFAISAAPQTADEAKRRCLYYYENSYATSQPAPGTGIVTATGQRHANANSYFDGVASILYKKRFGLVYAEEKRVAPTVKFYSPASTTSGFVQMGIARGSGYGVSIPASPLDVAIAGWSATGASAKSVVMIPANTTSIATAGTGQVYDEGVITYHFEADARLGI